MENFKSLYVADGYIQHQALSTNATSLTGREAVITYFAKRIEAFPDLHIQSLTDHAGTIVRYAPLMKVGIEGFVELGRAPDPANPTSLRLKLGIEIFSNSGLASRA